jgi:hypothetical protein
MYSSVFPAPFIPCTLERPKLWSFHCLLLQPQNMNTSLHYVFFFSFREAVREMAEPMTIKRTIKHNLVHSVSRKSKRVPLSTWKMMKYNLSMYFKKVSCFRRNQMCLPPPSPSPSPSSTVWIIHKLTDDLSKHRFPPKSLFFPPHIFHQIFLTSSTRLPSGSCSEPSFVR